MDKFIEKVLENTEILYKTDGNCLYDNGTILWNINPYGKEKASRFLSKLNRKFNFYQWILNRPKYYEENPKLEIVPGQYNNLLRIYVHSKW